MLTLLMKVFLNGSNLLCNKPYLRSDAKSLLFPFYFSFFVEYVASCFDVIVVQ